jgi:hypothetical protein
MFNIITKGLSIATPIIAHFRLGWDSKPWVPLMFHYLLSPHRQNILMFSLRPTKPPDSLSGFNTSANRSRRLCKNPMLSTSNAVINIEYRTSFRLATKSSYICRRSISHVPIRSSTQFSMGLTLSPRMWVAMLLRSTLHPSLECTHCSMQTSFIRICHPYWKSQRSQKK